MNDTPASGERVQKYVFNFEIHRFAKKAAKLPHPPLYKHCGSYYLVKLTNSTTIANQSISRLSDLGVQYAKWDTFPQLKTLPPYTSWRLAKT